MRVAYIGLTITNVTITENGMFAKRSKITFIYKFVMYNYEHVEVNI